MSVNTDGVVTLALTDNGGTFASPNAFTDNLSFLAWGNDNDDNGIIEDINTELPSNVLTRLDREWRVQEKGTVGNVTLEVDINGITPNGGGDFTGNVADDFLLLIDDGGDFSNGISRSIPATSYNSGTQVITFDVDFVDGDIFTIATSRASAGPGGVNTNLLLWLRPDRDVLNTSGATIADGEEVGTWTDQTSSALAFTRDAIANPTDAGPSYMAIDTDFNSNPSLEWNNTGNGDYLARTGFPFPATDFSLFTTQRIAAVDEDNSHILNYFEATGRILELRNFDAINFEIVDDNQNTGESVVDQTSVTAFNYTQSTPSLDLFVNGSASIGNSFTGVGNTGTLAQNGTLLIGERINGALNAFANARRLVGRLGDIIMFDDIISATDRDQVQSYLAIKYGITLNNGDFDYISSQGTSFFPGNSDSDFSLYRTDVAGIGRDDNSDYQQLTSKSINTSAILSITKNTDFNGSDQYIMWANNGSAVGASTSTDFPSGTESRSDRVWRIKLTNSPMGTIDMTFDLSGASIDQASDLRLIIDSDGDFIDASVLNPTVSQNGNNFTFSGVDIANFIDKDFFTIASVDNDATPLPLDFLSFTVTESDNEVLLSWITTNEVNVDYFDIERSGDGLNFDLLGQVKA
ncbi:MAG: hypothetical protein AAFY41_07430, partial [Bacteroidota bacterium]